MTIRTILLAADFSNPAKAAACQAKLLAEHFGARLKLLHVVSYPVAIPGAPEYGAQLGEWFTARAEQETAELQSFFAGELKAADVEYVVREGDPAKRIVEYAHSNDVDMIVMPAHGQGPFRRFLLGSVTAKVLHDVECPVWTGIHRENLPAGENPKIETIVCAVGVGPQSAKVTGWAAQAADSFGARLFLVHVIAGDAPVEPDAAGARERIEALKQDCRADAEVIMATGEIPQAICREAERLHAGLMIIGRSPQSGIFGRLPTNAYAIVRDSPCPVVSV